MRSLNTEFEGLITELILFYNPDLVFFSGDILVLAIWIVKSSSEPTSSLQSSVFSICSYSLIIFADYRFVFVTNSITLVLLDVFWNSKGSYGIWRVIFYGCWRLLKSNWGTSIFWGPSCLVISANYSLFISLSNSDVFWV